MNGGIRFWYVTVSTEIEVFPAIYRTPSTQTPPKNVYPITRKIIKAAAHQLTFLSLSWAWAERWKLLPGGLVDTRQLLRKFGNYRELWELWQIIALYKNSQKQFITLENMQSRSGNFLGDFFKLSSVKPRHEILASYEATPSWTPGVLTRCPKKWD